VQINNNFLAVERNYTRLHNGFIPLEYENNEYFVGEDH
jgi:hypothetical protein